MDQTVQERPGLRGSGRIARVAFGLAVGLLGAEGGARLAEGWLGIGEFARHLDAETAGCATASPTRIYEVVGRCGRDEHGFLLDQGRPLGNPSARRLMILGDSIGEQRWTLDLGDALQRKGRGQVEVWNAALGGYGTCQAAAAARELAPIARPHVVVVQTCPNDVFGSPVVLTGPEGDASVILGGGRRRFPRALLHSALFRTGVMQLAGRGQPDATVAEARACAQGLLAALGTTPVVVVHFPALVDDPADPLLREEADVLAAWSDAPGIRLRERLTPRRHLAALRETTADPIHPSEAVQHELASLLVDDVAAALFSGGRGATVPSSTEAAPRPDAGP